MLSWRSRGQSSKFRVQSARIEVETADFRVPRVWRREEGPEALGLGMNVWAGHGGGEKRG